MSKNKTRLMYSHLMEISSSCMVWINMLDYEASKEPTKRNLNKCVASVLKAVMEKADRKMIGIIPMHGHTLRINQAEVSAILYMRNDRGWKGSWDNNGVFRLLQFNNV